MVAMLMGNQYAIQRCGIDAQLRQTLFNFRGANASINQQLRAVHFHKNSIALAATGQNPNLHLHGSYHNT